MMHTQQGGLMPKRNTARPSPSHAAEQHVATAILAAARICNKRISITLAGQISRHVLRIMPTSLARRLRRTCDADAIEDVLARVVPYFR